LNDDVQVTLKSVLTFYKLHMFKDLDARLDVIIMQAL